MTDKHKLVLKDLTDSNYKLDKRDADLFKSLAKTREQHRKDDDELLSDTPFALQHQWCPNVSDNERKRRKLDRPQKRMP